MTEKGIENIIYKKYPFLFRNDNGMAYRIDGTRFRYGLIPGSGDMIGWIEKTITPDMVGQKIAIFTSIEIKTIRDKISKKQINWFNAVEKSGGIAQIYRETKGENIEIVTNIKEI